MDVSQHIDQVQTKSLSPPQQPMVDPSLETSNCASPSPAPAPDLPRMVTNKSSTDCRRGIGCTVVQLRTLLQDLNLQIAAIDLANTSGAGVAYTNMEDMKEVADTVKQCLNICGEATEQVSAEHVNVFEDVRAADDGHQLILSTIGDLISAKRVTLGARSTQWLGQMSDSSLQQLSKDRGVMASSEVDVEKGRHFENRHGVGRTANSLTFEFENSDEVLQAQKGGTVADAQDMHRMGKSQQLQRNFRFITIVGFIMILQFSWESVLIAAQYGLQNGGTAGAIWMTLGVIFGVLCLVATMAEMTSMAPTSGGQYHWVSEFARPSIQKPLSYMVGWMSSLGWITGCPATAQLTGSLIQGLVYLRYPDANFGALWQFSLLVMLILLLASAFNLFGTKALPTAEGIFLMIHVLGYFAFLIVFWVMSDHSSATEVFTTFADEGGWGSNGLATLVGITTPLWSFLGPDSGAHMSEEMRDAGSVLPSAMIWATLGNCAFGFTMLITFCFCAGDIDGLLNSSSGIPVIQVTYTATNSFAGTAILTLVLILISFVSCITCIATTSRQVWSLARDGGFPFSSWISYVKPGWDIPFNSILVVLLLSLATTCLGFGSEVATNAVISLSNAGLLASYIGSVTLITLKRIRGERLLPRRWSLGRWGLPINLVALGFLWLSFVLSFFPAYVKPSLADMNWAIVMFSGVVVFASVDYYLRAHRAYRPPVDLVRKYT
ncbi:hypothetical protein DV736_g1556, partial [Chaetothyriales sp. CBS 134916]